MVKPITTLGKRRYVGDAASRIVHDRWHTDCQGCGLRDIVRRGDAVGFHPDTLDGALWEGYEYCEACHDKTEPTPPDWAVQARAEGERSRRGTPPSTAIPQERVPAQEEFVRVRQRRVEV